jgi:hypothetical protein
MKTLILRDYSNKSLSYDSNTASHVLGGELENLFDETIKLHEQRRIFLSGISWYKREVVMDVQDEFGIDSTGELLRFRSHFTLHPAPTALRNFETSTRIIMWLVRILRANCFEIKKRLNTMRTIIDEAQDNNITIPELLQEMHLNCEKLYFGIQVDIGFLANIVTTFQC